MIWPEHLMSAELRRKLQWSENLGLMTHQFANKSCKLFSPACSIRAFVLLDFVSLTALDEDLVAVRNLACLIVQEVYQDKPRGLRLWFLVPALTEVQLSHYDWFLIAVVS